MASNVAAAAGQDGDRFFVPAPNPRAMKQIADSRRKTARPTRRIQALATTPTGVWVTTGSAEQAEHQVSLVTQQAAAQHTLPLLVLCNIPLRDWAHYSAGGAASVADYKDWVDGVARGIGNRTAAIAIEPDSIGIIPWYTNLDGAQERWSRH